MVVEGGAASAFYDLDNRITSWQRLYVGAEDYGYLADNKRVWKKDPGGAEQVFFYGADGRKLLTFVVQSSPLALNPHTLNVYFGGKLIRADGVSVVHDRLGSVVARSSCWICSTVDKLDYFPYGDEIGPATFGNVNKFGTYHHDHTSKLSYADQRYYSGFMGRFMTPDS